jgi:hypothetical protein
MDVVARYNVRRAVRSISQEVEMEMMEGGLTAVTGQRLDSEVLDTVDVEISDVRTEHHEVSQSTPPPSNPNIATDDLDDCHLLAPWRFHPHFLRLRLFYLLLVTRVGIWRGGPRNRLLISSDSQRSKPPHETICLQGLEEHSE